MDVVLCPILGTIYSLLRIYEVILFIAILLTWVNADPYNPIVRILYSITMPLLNWIRRKVPLHIGILDLSPLILFIIIEIIQRIIIRIMVKLPC